MTLLIFVLASAIGAMKRFFFERFSLKHFGEQWPWGTLAANVAGSALFGWIVGADLSTNVTTAGAAFCGAFTTFGGFIAQTSQRWTDRRLIALAYLALTVSGSLFAAWCGLAIAG